MAFTFWYDFSSTYSYLAALRIDRLAGESGVEVAWSPFLLGPIFADAGYSGSPNLASDAKARYMWSDIARRSAHRGHAFVEPASFPFKSVTAARAALALKGAERARFSKAVFEEAFGKGNAIERPDTLRSAAEAAGLDPTRLLERTGDPVVKQKLFDAVDAARQAGIFGAPSFVTSDGTLFWGDDRLRDALSFERTGRLADCE